MIEPMLVLTTGQLTEQTCNVWLHSAPFAVFAKGDYGWFVYVPDDEPEDLPPDAAACLALARECSCAWIMFDRDADVVAGLSVDDW